MFRPSGRALAVGNTPFESYQIFHTWVVGLLTRFQWDSRCRPRVDRSRDNPVNNEGNPHASQTKRVASPVGRERVSPYPFYVGAPSNWEEAGLQDRRYGFEPRRVHTTKPKPRWDVHLPGAGNRGGSLAGVFRPLIAGPSGSAVSPRLSGWTARPGICRPSPAPPPCSPGTDCQWPPLSPSPKMASSALKSGL